ncbi:MAG: peptide chain release factor N(5)-glutamine methyltransferase [Nitrospiraceae bacterium]|nr:peptide chain release factor N(5)-glutamine methyltransferase [Nitrospiraceae bacterium]
MTIAQALDSASRQLIQAHIEDPRLEAEVLLAHLLGRERSWIYLHFDLSLSDSLTKEFMTLVARRTMHEPTAYILGQREFWSLPFRVTRDTLIPRPETELVVETAISIIRHEGWTRPVILDLGTGCGILAIALAYEIPGASFVATDRSFAALILARQNASRLGVESRICMLQADWICPFRSREIGMQGFDLVVSNPPYVAYRDRKFMAKEVLDYEPKRALFAGKDGMKEVTRLIKTVPRILHKGAWFVCEIGWDQGRQALQAAIDSNMYRHIEIKKDLSGRDRILLLQGN